MGEVNVLAALKREKLRETGLSPAVLEAMPQPVVVLDRDGVIFAFNRSFLNSAGLDQVDCAPGATLAELARLHGESGVLRQMAAAVGEAKPAAGPDKGDASVVRRTDIADGTRVLTVETAQSSGPDHASRSKAAFLASMSHELRTPLNSVIGFADIIKEQMFGPIGSDKYIEYAEEIRNSGHGLLSIINNIIDLSRIESGQFKLREEDTDMGELVQGVVKRLSEQTAAAQVKVTVESLAGLPPVSVDPRALQQVLGNILANAVKFTPPGGRICVGLARQGDNIETTVADTGCGMPPEHLARLGEAFLQADDVLARSHQGAGLGLALAKALVLMSGGRMEVTSESGKGTRVAIALPVPRAATPAA